MKPRNEFPAGWNEQRVRELLAHYESQTEQEAVAEDEAAFEHECEHESSSKTTSAATVNISRVAHVNIAALISNARLLPALQEKAEAADVLLISNDGHVKEQVRYFPSGTAELFTFLRRNLPEGLQSEAAIEESEYQELSLHGALLTLATVACQYLAAPLLVNCIFEYLKTRLNQVRMSKTTVKARLLIFKTKTQEYLEFSYSGPASEFRDLMLSEIQKATLQLKADDNHEHQSPTLGNGEASSRRQRRSKPATGRVKD